MTIKLEYYKGCELIKTEEYNTTDLDVWVFINIEIESWMNDSILNKIVISYSF